MYQNLKQLKIYTRENIVIVFWRGLLRVILFEPDKKIFILFEI